PRLLVRRRIEPEDGAALAPLWPTTDPCNAANSSTSRSIWLTNLSVVIPAKRAQASASRDPVLSGDEEGQDGVTKQANQPRPATSVMLGWLCTIARLVVTGSRLGAPLRGAWPG